MTIKLLWNSGFTKYIDPKIESLCGKRDKTGSRADIIYITANKEDTDLVELIEEAKQYSKHLTGIVVVDMGDAVEIIRMSE